MAKRKCLACSAECDERISVFGFPTDAAVRGKWAEFCNIDVEEIKASSWLCSRHFAPESFRHSVQARKRLNLQKGAIPTLHRETPSASQTPSQEHLREGGDRNLENVPPTKLVPVVDLTEGEQPRRLPKYRRGGPTKTRFCLICGNVDARLIFFRFPANSTERGKWLESLAINECDVNLKSNRICSRHFPSGDKSCLPVRCVKDVAPIGQRASSRSEEQSSMALKVRRVTLTEGNSKKTSPVACGTLFVETPAAPTSGTSFVSSERRTDRKAPLPNWRLLDVGLCESVYKEEHDPVDLEVEQNLQCVTPDGSSCSDESETSGSDNASGTGRDRRHFYEFTISDLESPRRRRQCLELCSRQLSKYRSQVKVVQQQHLRLQKKLKNVEGALKTLQHQGLISKRAVDTLRALLS